MARARKDGCRIVMEVASGGRSHQTWTESISDDCRFWKRYPHTHDSSTLAFGGRAIHPVMSIALWHYHYFDPMGLCAPLAGTSSQIISETRKKREIAAFGGGAGPRPCDVGHSFGYHIDISDIDANGYPLRHDDDMTAVSEITNDEAIRSPAGMVRALRSVSVPDNVLLLFPLKSGSRKKKLELQTPTISSAGPSTQENTPKDCTPTVKLFQRRSMETIRSKWKKSTPELKANVVAVSTKLRRSLLKQNIV